MTASRPLVGIDGRTPHADELVHAALVNYGHFTAMQVRGGAVRGLDLHLGRLRSAHAELFGTDLDADAVRSCMKWAVRDTPDAYLRVTVFETGPGSPSVMTVLRPPVEVSSTPLTLSPVEYLRPLAHIKSTGTFAQIHYGELAERSGFDDALLVAPDGSIAETTMANIGFVSGRTIVWPSAPALRGITRQLIDAHAADAGLRVVEASVALTDLTDFDAAFAANSIGIAPVAVIASHRFEPRHDSVLEVADLYRNIAPDTI